MKVWARIRKDNKTVGQHTVEIAEKRAEDVTDWSEPIGELCRELNLARPVMLKKHVNDLLNFSHTAFRPGDFMESVDFDRLEIELF